MKSRHDRVRPSAGRVIEPLPAHNQLSALIAAAREHSIIGTDPDGVITIFNTGAERTLGYRADEIVGRCTPEVFHDPLEVIRRAAELGIEPGFETIVHAARGGGVDTRDWTFVARDRSRRIMSVSVAGVRDDDGTLAGFLAFAVDVTEARTARREPAIVHDVTERHQATERPERTMTELALAEENFRGAFADAPGAAALLTVDAPDGRVDAEALRSGPVRFLRVNRAYADLLGRRQDDLVGAALDEVVHPGDRHLPPGSTDPRMPVRARYLHASGRTIWVETSCSAVAGQSGTPRCYVQHVVDLTARMEADRALLDALEQQRRAAAGAELLERTRTDLISTISHELRTPLTVIHGYLEVLTDGGAGPLNTYQDAMMSIVLRNCERLASFVGDVLTLARLDDVGIDGRRDVPVDMNELCSCAMDEIGVLARAKHHTVTLDCPAPNACTVGDPEQLRRALLNLLDNAVTYTEPGGSIAVRTQITTDAVEVTITDTGTGIPLAEQGELFEPFGPAATSNAPTMRTGLGLAITKSIVEGHHGTIEVDSVVGEGTRVTIALPLDRVACLGAGPRRSLGPEYRPRA